MGFEIADSGIHGAFVVLDPAFNAEVMATAMGIPTSKNIIRRHLATELESLVQVARFVFTNLIKTPHPLSHSHPISFQLQLDNQHEVYWYWSRSITEEYILELFRARYEQRSRQARAERKRAEKLDVISIGRSLSRSFTTGLSLASHDREEIYTRCGGDSNLLLTKSNMRVTPITHSWLYFRRSVNCTKY